MNGVAHKKPISGSAASGTSDYRVRLQFVGKIWERVCGKECRDLSTFHYSQEAYGPRIDLLHLFSFSFLFLLLPFPLRYVTREKKAFRHIPKLSKSEVTRLKISPSILQILGRLTSAIYDPLNLFAVMKCRNGKITYSLNCPCATNMQICKFFIFYAFIFTILPTSQETLLSFYKQKFDFDCYLISTVDKVVTIRNWSDQKRLKRKLRSRKCYPNKIITFLRCEKILKILFHARYKEKIVHSLLQTRLFTALHMVKILWKFCLKVTNTKRYNLALKTISFYVIELFKKFYKKIK